MMRKILTPTETAKPLQIPCKVLILVVLLLNWNIVYNVLFYNKILWAPLQVAMDPAEKPCLMLLTIKPGLICLVNRLS